MLRHTPFTIVMMMLWDRINTSPWITLKCIGASRGDPIIYLAMQHSKTRARQTFQLEARHIYTLRDSWTQDYVLGYLRDALSALIHNSVEASTGSLDVYREDCP